MMNIIVIAFLAVAFLAILFYCKKSHDYEPIISLIAICAAALVICQVLKMY